jgi:orsellinic acid C2-O-methyltransferase
MSNVDVEGATHLRQMISGYMISQLICATATLGVADILTGGAMTDVELAKQTNTHAPSLARLLRALTALGLVNEPEPGRFNMTALGDLLRTDVPGSLRNDALLLGSDPFWRAWADLLHAIRTGGTAFEHLFDMGPFQYNTFHPDHATVFNAFMADTTRRATAAILAAHDFAGYRIIVDVGGGNGTLLSSILARAPGSAGIVFDSPEVIASARRHADVAAVVDRCQLVAGDFFQSVPEVADAYVLKSILHDWNDDQAVVILGNCRRAMRSDSRLLIMERLLPDLIECTDAHREIVMLDMQMLVLAGGRERTIAQYATLLTTAGLRLIGSQPTASQFTIMEAVKSDTFTAHPDARDGGGRQ